MRLFTILFVLLFFQSSAQWNKVDIPFSYNLKHLIFSDSMNIFVLGGDNINTILLHSSDGGISWNQELSNNQVYGIDFLNKDQGIVLGNDKIFITQDGGKSWISKVVESNYTPSPFVKMLSQNHWIYVRGQRHAHTYDSGKTWEEISHGNSGPIPTEITDFHRIGNNKFTGIGWYNPSIFTSKDEGHSWEILHEFFNESYLSSLAYITNSTLFATGGGGIFISNDSGITWQLNYSNGHSFECIRHIDSNTIYAVGDNGTILRSFDQGATWDAEIANTKVSLNRIAINGNKGVIIGDSGTILVNNNMPLSSSTNLQIGNTTAKIYPNPCSDQLNIRSGRAIQQWNIYQMGSKEIQSAKTRSQSKAIHIQTGHLKAGFYLLKITYHDQSVGYHKFIKN